MTSAQIEKKAQGLVDKIKGNIHYLDCSGSWHFFLKMQRETWNRIGRHSAPVKARVHELLRDFNNS